MFDEIKQNNKIEWMKWSANEEAFYGFTLIGDERCWYDTIQNWLGDRQERKKLKGLKADRLASKESWNIRWQNS